ncbi:MAG: hypothetical protein WED00_14850 [Aquisalimonadaceae bacterium]
MPDYDPLLITPFPVLSVLLWVIVAMVAGYLARGPVHRLLLSVFRALRHLMRMLSLYADGASRRLRDWTNDVAVAQARAAAVRQVQWDYDRLAIRVERELADTPDLRRRLGEQLIDIEADFRRSAEPPAEPPAWGQITDTVGRLAEDRTGQVARTLEDIRDAMAQYRADARDAQRRASYRRYLLLHRTRPRWRRVQRLLDHLDDRLARLQVRIDGLSQRIAEFDVLRKSDGPTMAALVAACVWRCIMATVALLVAGGGIVVLTTLVVQPLQAMMGQGVLAFGLPGYQVTGGILVFFQLVLGLVMMETLRATDMSPAIGSLDAPLRRLLFWVSFGLLLVLATVGAVLYYALAESGLVAGQTVISLGGDALLLALLTSVTHALMVFFLPFVLVLAALPLAVFARTARVVVAAALTLAVRLLAMTTRLLAVSAGLAGGLLVQLYDVLIFLPLWMERLLQRSPDRSGVTGHEEAPSTTLVPAPSSGKVAPIPAERSSGSHS